MLKSEAAAIRTRPPFDAEIVDFLEALSKVILKDRRCKEYADVVTFAFWCRKASVLAMRRQYDGHGLRVGRGLVFHIAPSNVAVNFAYSLVAGLLAGNANVVRLPSKPFIQVDLIREAIANALLLFPNLAPYIELIRYGHDRAITDELSGKCDARVIWGGDDTIKEIRLSALRPRAVDIAFADRYSIAVIDAGKYMEKPDKAAIARNFYNDTYLSDQNACTSPKLIVWLGSDSGNATNTAQNLFWSHLNVYVQGRYELRGVQAVHKLSRMMLLAANGKDITYIPGVDNYIYRVKIGTLSDEIFKDSGHSGFFMEYWADDLSDIAPVCGEKCQTLSYLGVEPQKIAAFIHEYAPKGIDRVVPIGKTMDFSLVWDGYDLIIQLSRTIII